MTKPPILRVAAPKGYLWAPTQQLFLDMGYEFEDDLSKSRKLFTWDKTETIQLLMIRPWDIPTYVQEGVADIGIVGKDVLIEQSSGDQSAQVLELLDLQYGHCSLVVASKNPHDKLDNLAYQVRVATKYYNATTHFFHKAGITIRPIKLYGAIELAPITGLSDLICDLTATGKTLEANDLTIIETVFESTARLIVNPVSMKLLYSRILELVDRLPLRIT